jgi:hypothetical protein
VNDLREGQGVMYLMNGDSYKGNWVKNMMDGQGKYFYRSEGQEYDGLWKLGKRHGQGIIRFV